MTSDNSTGQEGFDSFVALTTARAASAAIPPRDPSSDYRAWERHQTELSLLQAQNDLFIPFEAGYAAALAQCRAEQVIAARYASAAHARAAKPAHKTRPEQVLDIIAFCGSCSATTVANEVGFSLNRAQAVLREMVRDGSLCRVQSAVNAATFHYTLSPAVHERLAAAALKGQKQPTAAI